MKVTYTKMKDESWGLRIAVENGEKAPVKGDVVSVLTKGGESREVTVDRIVWSGVSEGGENVIIAKPIEKKPDANGNAQKQPSPEAKKAEKKTAGFVCPHCGSHLSVSVAA